MFFRCDNKENDLDQMKIPARDTTVKRHVVLLRFHETEQDGGRESERKVCKRERNSQKFSISLKQYLKVVQLNSYKTYMHTHFRCSLPTPETRSTILTEKLYLFHFSNSASVFIHEVFFSHFVHIFIRRFQLLYFIHVFGVSVSFSFLVCRARVHVYEKLVEV